MKVMCQKCGSYANLVTVNCRDIFLGYLCAQHNLEFTKILTKMQEQHFQKSMDKYKEFVGR